MHDPRAPLGAGQAPFAFRPAARPLSTALLILVGAMAFGAAGCVRYFSPYQSELAQPGAFADWADEEMGELDTWYPSLLERACPPTIDPSTGDYGSPMETFHGAAAWEDRVSDEATGGGLQCTYDKNGDLLDRPSCTEGEVCFELATADRGSPDQCVMAHHVLDVVPFGSARLEDGYDVTTDTAPCTTLYVEGPRPPPGTSAEGARTGYNQWIQACRERAALNTTVRLPAVSLSIPSDMPGYTGLGVSSGVLLLTPALRFDAALGFETNLEADEGGHAFTAGVGAGAHWDIWALEGRLSVHAGEGGATLLPGVRMQVTEALGIEARWRCPIDGPCAEAPELVFSVGMGLLGLL